MITKTIEIEVVSEQVMKIQVLKILVNNTQAEIRVALWRKRNYMNGI